VNIVVEKGLSDQSNNSIMDSDPLMDWIALLVAHLISPTTEYSIAICLSIPFMD
jgi:hypothetical protein